MDPTVNPLQNDQPMNRAQPPVTGVHGEGTVQIGTTTQPQIQTPTTISVNKESGPAIIVQESGDSNNEEAIEMQPSIPEPTIEASVENIVEKSPDQEKPVIAEAVKQAGVTHSGPGVILDTPIKIKGNAFGIQAPPVTYQQAELVEKETEFTSSKHWLMGKFMYVWRKINPAIAMKGKVN